MKVHLNTLGCRLNEAELETWAEQFRGRGATIVTDAGDADLAVLNTCAVTAEAVRKSRQTLRRLHRTNPQAKLVVTGCHATLASEQVAGELRVEKNVHDRLAMSSTKSTGSAPSVSRRPC